MQDVLKADAELGRLTWESIAAAARWWGEFLEPGSTTIHDTGSTPDAAPLSRLLTRIAAMAPKEPGMRARFEAAFLDELREGTYRGGEHSYLHYILRGGSLRVSTDYQPQDVLRAICKRCGLIEADMLLPIKTRSVIYPGRLRASQGYGQPMVTVYDAWPAEPWRGKVIEDSWLVPARRAVALGVSFEELWTHFRDPAVLLRLAGMLGGADAEVQRADAERAGALIDRVCGADAESPYTERFVPALAACLREGGDITALERESSGWADEWCEAHPAESFLAYQVEPALTRVGARAYAYYRLIGAVQSARDPRLQPAPVELPPDLAASLVSAYGLRPGGAGPDATNNETRAAVADIIRELYPMPDVSTEK